MSPGRQHVEAYENVNAIILAAGRGSRMRDLTRQQPKCMVPLMGKSLLAWQLEALRSAGASNILVVRGYLGQLLQGDFDTVDNPRWEETNMVASLQCAAQWLRQAPCIVSYSDIAYRPDHVRALCGAAGGLALSYDSLWESLWRLRFADPLADAETFDASCGLLRDIGAKPRSIQEVKGQYMGLLRFTPQSWGVIAGHLQTLPQSTLDRLDMTSLLRMMLAQGLPITAVEVSGGWCEVDSESDLVAYEARLRDQSAGSAWSHDFRNGSHFNNTWS